jgi:hypothetical protein
MLVGIARKIPNHVTVDHVCGGINKRRGGFNNSLYLNNHTIIGWIIVIRCIVNQNLGCSPTLALFRFEEAQPQSYHGIEV